MSSIGPEGPAGRAVDPARLQPEVGPLDLWAETPAERADAERIDRLAGDRDLVGELRRLGFSGPVWQHVAEELVRYGVAVMTAWTIKGTVFDKCARRGRPVERPPSGVLDRDEAASLAGEVVAESLNRFRDEVLVPQRWDPKRGASLTTFFVGQCVLRFPNIYRTWLAQVPDRQTLSDSLLLERSGHERVEDDVILDLTATQTLRAIPSVEAREAFVLVALGYRQREVAERMGTTEKAVERMLAYARRQLQRGEEECA